jgi:hypothetical protein
MTINGYSLESFDNIDTNIEHYYIDDKAPSAYIKHRDFSDKNVKYRVVFEDDKAKINEDKAHGVYFNKNDLNQVVGLINNCNSNQ